MSVRPTLALCALAMMCVSMAGSEMKGFEGQMDVGRVALHGSASYDGAGGSYRITGSGENMWGNKDSFFFLWKRMSGDASLRTTITWEGTGKNPHRKAGWMLRAGLDDDAPYVDLVLHGDGLVSLQYRKAKGDVTRELQSPLRGSATFLLERHGDQVTGVVFGRDGKEHPFGTITISLQGELYAGLAVCSHDSTVLETAQFSDVKAEQFASVADDKRVVESTLEVLDIESGVRTIVRRAKEHFEAPNWSRDGKLFYYNSKGRMFTLPVDGGTPTPLITGFADRCNNDHGLSPDGKQLVISHHARDGKSMIYVLPSAGGEPRKVTQLGPSYWHGWSPDGKMLAYCAERNGEFDVYSIPVGGGEEKRLTSAPGLDDGPDYSPDGKYIYFNSARTGQMKIWRMKADGSEQVQFTPDDNYGDWFAHPSPDGKWIAFLSYDKSVEGHPENKDVVLRMMPASGGEPKVAAMLFGGQGTINVPSWSPDSKRFAFVSYRLVK
jgi:TolB protein